MKEPNKIIIVGEYAEVVLCDRYGNEKARALVDIDDIELVSKYRWNLKNDEYVRTTPNRGAKEIFMHRLIMDVTSKEVVVDHINHYRFDNRKLNLRKCSRTQNNMNMQPTEQNKHGIVGVSYDRTLDRYIATIQVSGNRIRKRFRNLEEAVIARKELELEYFGEYRFKGDVENAS